MFMFENSYIQIFKDELLLVLLGCVERVCVGGRYMYPVLDAGGYLWKLCVCMCVVVVGGVSLILMF